MTTDTALGIDSIARICHAANRELQIVANEIPSPAWDDAPAWQRDSALAGVRATFDGTATTPEEQHETWCAHKRADGWVYGETKDADAKTHPCMVAYADLPAIQQAKDHLFRAIVSALSATR